MQAAHKDITLGQLPIYHAYPDDNAKHPGLVLIHEIWGLDAHIKDVADRFAAAGYSVIAPNLFHDQPFDGKVDPSLLNDMQNPAKKDEAQKTMRAIMAPIMAPEFAGSALAELKACVDYLAGDAATNDQIGVLGFCFGGSYSFHLAANDTRIKVALPYYGQPPAADEITNITCPVLAFYGDQDEPLMQSLPELKRAMQANHKDFEAVVYPGAAHAFFNDTNPQRYNQAAADDSWRRALAFLNRHLGG